MPKIHLSQQFIGPTDSISLEEARQNAKKIRSATLMGYDPNVSLVFICLVCGSQKE